MFQKQVKFIATDNQRNAENDPDIEEYQSIKIDKDEEIDDEPLHKFQNILQKTLPNSTSHNNNYI